MGLSLYLAKKYIVNNKRRTFFLTLIISIILMMTIAITVIMENGINRQKVDAQINDGKWHMALILEDESAINKIRNNENTEKASIVKRTLPFSLGEDYFEVFLVEQENMDLMYYNLSKGREPKEDGEIIVPEWYLRRENIKNLPVTISENELEFTITGSYTAQADSIYQENIKVFMALEESRDFTDEFLTNSPYDNIINNDQNKTFLFIELSKSANLELTQSQYLETQGIKAFDIGLDGMDKKPLYNYSLLAAEGRADFKENISYNDSNFLIEHFPLLLHIILLAVLFITIFVAMNLIITNDVRLIGIFSALGISPLRIRSIILFQSLFLSILAIPMGIFLGITSSYTFLQLTIGKMDGSVQIPLFNIVLNILICMVAVVIASIYPAIKASKISPVEAMSTIQGLNQKKGPDNKFTIKKTRNRFSFAVLFGIKNIIENKERIISFIIIISALLGIFIKLSSMIEVSWRSGDWRRSYDSDYEISMDASSDNQKPIDINFIRKIKELDGVKDVYYQYSIFDMDEIKNVETLKYYFKLPKETLTEQAYKQLNLSAPITRNNYNDEVFVMAGISGYTEKELNDLSRRYLIEGEINIEEMKKEPIVLLPKYIQWLGNMDIPYTSLEVGDTVTIVDDNSDSLLDINIGKRYDFKIGGFLSSLPLQQVNGVSNGFVAIMYYDHLNLLDTEYKGIKGVYIDEESFAKVGSKLEQFAEKNSYDFVNNIDSFERNEKRDQETMMTYAFYSIFMVLGMVIFLSIFNLILSNIFMRRKEFTMLYAIGILKWQRALSIIIEIITFTLPGIIFGIGAGIFMIISGDLRSEILTLPQIIPWIHILSASMIVVLAAFLTMIIGISYINKNCNIQDIYGE